MAPKQESSTEGEQPAQSGSLASFSVVLAEMKGRDRCYCGENVGHVGWLLCCSKKATA